MDIDRLLDEIRDETRQTWHLTGRPALDARVLGAIRQVPRQEFVPHSYHHEAYDNRPLPIGLGQTISQPYVVALMSDLIRPRTDAVVLEVGTGSGYQAAILSKLVKQAYSVEIIEELARQASERLRRLGYANVAVRMGNGRLGWPDHAPYDAIVVTAAATKIPSALLFQLKFGGTLVMPVGAWNGAQDLLVVDKRVDGSLDSRRVLPVAFVPLTGSDQA